MSKTSPADRLYSKDHEWVKDNGDGTAMIGITDYAQEMLTDIVFVELPAVGKKVAQGEPVAVVESVKSVSDVYAPVSGEVIEANAELDDKPELVNEDVYGNGWLIKISISDPSELDELMSAAEYEQMIAK